MFSSTQATEQRRLRLDSLESRKGALQRLCALLVKQGSMSRELSAALADLAAVRYQIRHISSRGFEEGANGTT
jgi:hypothetical protein